MREMLCQRLPKPATDSVHCTKTAFDFCCCRGNRFRYNAIPVPSTTIQLSMAAGEFVDLYKNDVGSWDGVMTCFFVDTAKNINIYVKRFATILREGGPFIPLC